MSEDRTVTRVGDMHPTRALRIVEHADRDVTLIFYQEGYPVGEMGDGGDDVRRAVIEYCVSGGRSPHTVQALHTLADAMRRDGEGRPIA